MAPELRRRTVGALIIALTVTAIAMATVRLTVAMATLMFLYFSAMCPLFFGMSMFGLYRKNRDRFKLVLWGVGVFTFICAMIAFRLRFDDLYPQAREAIFEIATGVMVANIWAVVAAWLLEAGVSRQDRLHRQGEVPDSGDSGLEISGGRLQMAPELRRRTVGALIIALTVTAIAMATVRLTVAMATLMFLYFSAMCPLFFGMSMFGLYRKNRDRFKLVLWGVGVFTFICAMIAFRLRFDDLYPQAREAIFEIATGAAVAITWAVVAAWLMEAGVIRQDHLHRQGGDRQDQGGISGQTKLS